MHLQRTSCILCGEHIINIQYNLKTTLSEKSKVVLIKFVEKIYKNVFLMHCNICTNCYNLLNEIDVIQSREKELYDKLKYCISKVDNSSLENSSDKCIKSLTKGKLDNIIEGVDIKRLPIKIRKITQNVNSDELILQSNISNNFQEDKLALEKVQSIIQMDIIKHEEELNNKNKVSKRILCEKCGQTFKTKLGKKALLELHLLIHSGESRYQCEQCGKKFMHHSSFNIHKKIHLGQRNFKCLQCDKLFLTGSHLKRHIRATHTLEKGYSCSMCEKKFAENYNLMAHIKIHKVEHNLFTEIT
ncbi:hypothetical protein GWI33_020328 [Rhynchophorus ferrugineus]|uniref:C2H2-type domain-containing protein n=1 Tax=Rhynchophorus ferrugineus TaxID=354439 RepID=A0A834HPL5_RHYFE|nr:hypothetical protein GWI33_020328 [Rhynchophorus ferrugineus]